MLGLGLGRARTRCRCRNWCWVVFVLGRPQQPPRCSHTWGRDLVGCAYTEFGPDLTEGLEIVVV